MAHMQRITLPDFANILGGVFPPATYSKVFYWAKTGYLPTLKDPSMKRSHYYIDMRCIGDFLNNLGLIDQEITLIMKHLK